VSSLRPNDQPERRASKRFSIERTISYRVVGHGPVGASGSGTTVNMSSGGMLIATDRILSPGWRVEVEVAGPFQVDDRVLLKLVIMGRIVRSESGAVTLAALKISRHPF
jgi:c-di-GMP-binding flagellar brake protein YcgR